MISDEKITKIAKPIFFILLGILVVAIVCFIIIISDSSNGGGSDNPKVERCSACERKYQQIDSYGNYSDNYRSIKRTSMCVQCYENYKWMQDQIGDQPID